MANQGYHSNSYDTLLTRLVQWIFPRPNNDFHIQLNHRYNLEEFNYAMIDTIGEGSFGRVFRCRDIRTGQIVAIKQIEFPRESQGVPTSVIREISLLKELNHINIVRLLNVTSKDTHVNLVFEHLDYDLGRYITDPRYPKDRNTRKSFMHQILTAVAYCHGNKILHRDLKPRNLLIDDSKKIIKLADFGLAREFGNRDLLYTEQIATRWYRAPEVLLGSCQYSTKVDLWSVGCIFGEMVIGKPVFETDNCIDELDAIFRILGTPTEDTWPGVTKFTRFQMYSEFRPLNLSTIFADLEPEGLQLLSMLLCLNPMTRFSAEIALKHPYFYDLTGPGLSPRLSPGISPR